MTKVQTPPIAFALVLLFWSWQTGAWIVGVALAAGLEWADYTSQRWRLADKSLERLVDLTSLLVLGVVLYQYSQAPLSAGLFAALRWSPLLLAPLLAAQILSARPGLTYRALFLSKRRSRSPEADRTLDLRPVYLAACLLAAGTTSIGQSQSSYFLGLLILSVWMLAWPPRQQRSWFVWVGVFALTAMLAHVGQLGLKEAQRRVEDVAVAWLSEFFFGGEDPYRAQTALGDLGELKLSDRVLYRVTTDAPITAPLLLRTASYDRYANTTWFTRERDFEPVPQVGDGWQWLPAATAGTLSVRIGGYLKRRGDLLPLPIGTWRITDLPVDTLSRHPLGAIKASDGPPLVRYRVFYGDSAPTDRPPEESDRRIPNPEQAVLQRLVAELGLDAAEPEATIEQLRDYFATRFRYSLELPGTVIGQTALEHFLLERHRGHCEYFATATVLLLRQAGLPARYAVGYSVQEPGYESNGYLVRHSHAHAWALVWHHGRWWNLDTTPALWADQEAERRPFWQPVADWLSGLWYRFNLSRLMPGANDHLWLWGVLALLFAILAYRLRLGQRFIEQRAAQRRRRPAPSDSPLAELARTVTRAGWPRRSGETDRQWLMRLRREPALAEVLQDLEVLLCLHERARYRPGGLSAQEEHALQVEVARRLKLWAECVE